MGALPSASGRQGRIARSQPGGDELVRSLTPAAIVKALSRMNDAGDTGVIMFRIGSGNHLALRCASCEDEQNANLLAVGSVSDETVPGWGERGSQARW